MEVDISYELDFSPTTCTYDEGMAHYKHRTQVLTAISERIEKCTPPPMKLPDVKKICGGNFEAKAAARVPGAFQCAFLLEHIDTIADTMQWTVLTSASADTRIRAQGREFGPQSVRQV